MVCVVQGIIETKHVEALEILFLDLCGVHRDSLRIHELCLKSVPDLDFWSIHHQYFIVVCEVRFCSSFTIGLISSEFRPLCDLEQPEPTWTGSEKISVLVRNMAHSKVSKNALRLFNALGYKLDHELLRVVFAFHLNRGAPVTVTVASVNKMSKHAADEPVITDIQLVEVTSPASSENYCEVSVAISSFCKNLAPLLHLSKPGVSTRIVPSAAAAAASLMSDG